MKTIEYKHYYDWKEAVKETAGSWYDLYGTDYFPAVSRVKAGVNLPFPLVGGFATQDMKLFDFLRGHAGDGFEIERVSVPFPIKTVGGGAFCGPITFYLNTYNSNLLRVLVYPPIYTIWDVYSSAVFNRCLITNKNAKLYSEWDAKAIYRFITNKQFNPLGQMTGIYANEKAFIAGNGIDIALSLIKLEDKHESNPGTAILIPFKNRLLDINIG